MPGIGLASFEDPAGEKLVELVEYAPGSPAASTPMSPTAIDLTSPTVFALLNLSHYGPEKLVAGASWTYDIDGSPHTFRIVSDATPEWPGWNVLVDLIDGGKTTPLQIGLSPDRRTMTVAYGHSARDLAGRGALILKTPDLAPRMLWNPVGMEEGVVTGVEPRPVTTRAGHFADALKVSLELKDSDEMVFWFAHGVGLVSVEETRDRYSKQALELTGYRLAGARTAEARKIPAGVRLDVRVQGP